MDNRTFRREEMAACGAQALLGRGCRLALALLRDVCSAGGELLEAAERFVDRLGVGEDIEQVGGDDDDVSSLSHALVEFAANAFAEVEVGSRGERVEFVRLVHIVLSRLR